MGAIWLHDLPAVCRAAGLRVRTWPGWELRSRSSGGYDAVLAVGAHHTASSPSMTTDGSCRHMWETSATRPVGAIYLARDAEVVIGAAGATNTQGKGGPYRVSKGTIPLDAGNRYTIAIEAANNGVGEVWPKAQLDAYVTLCAALCKAYDLDPLRDVIAHFEWAPDRKIDPAGPPTPFAVATDRYLRWSMTDFRSAVAGARRPSWLPGGTVLHVTEPHARLLDTRSDGDRRPVEAGQARRIPIPRTPAGTDGSAAVVNVTVVGATAPGHVQVTGKIFGTGSTGNFYPGVVEANACLVAIVDGEISVRIAGSPSNPPKAHLVVDLQGVID